jgi:Uma2 family endonuclease
MAVINLQTQSDVTIAQPVATPGVPPLRHGDYLSRDEFERRYEAMADVKKAELIEGRVYMPSPVRWKNHGEPENQMSIWLGVYRVFTPGVFAANNSTVRLDQSNEPQPDVALRIGETSGGQTLLNPDGYLEGAPELAAEIAASSAPDDLDRKLQIYRRNGVREYIVLSFDDQQLHWFSLEAGEYVPLTPDSDGVIRSRAFPGLWLNVGALLNDDMAMVLTVLQQGLASAEHAAFVSQLAERKSAV